ncbi:hypothetical protein JCM15519_17310 [Fundidesulfovibrio butyratiphilus]
MLEVEIPLGLGLLGAGAEGGVVCYEHYNIPDKRTVTGGIVWRPCPFVTPLYKTVKRSVQGVVCVL